VSGPPHFKAELDDCPQTERSLDHGPNWSPGKTLSSTAGNTHLSACDRRALDWSLATSVS